MLSTNGGQCVVAFAFCLFLYRKLSAQKIHDLFFLA